MQLEQNPFGSTELQVREVGALAVQTREQAEVQALIVSAKKFPRDEMQCYQRLLKSMTRRTMAENAEYKFPRGGKDITGPTVDLAREALRCWGNARSGLRIVSIDDEYAHVVGFAFDLEQNNYREAEDKFKILVQRKDKFTQKTEWVKPDERDLRELCNRRGAICERNAILKLLPPDLIEDAFQAARDTRLAASRNELRDNKEDVLRRTLIKFDKLAVSKEMIEAWLGHEFNLITAEKFDELKIIGTSIAEGHSKREEHFNIPEIPNRSVKDRLKESLGKEKTAEGEPTIAKPMEGK